MKEVSGRKVELDEVLPLEPESSATQENVLWCLHRLERKLMMMIKVLRIKLLLNFVGPRGHVPHQSVLGNVVISKKKIPTHTQDHGDGIEMRGESVVHVPS